jgi:hypothetical protein
MAEEVLRKKERWWNSEIHQNSFLMVFQVSPPTFNANVFYVQIFIESNPVYDKTQDSSGVFPYFTDNSIKS